MLRSLWSSSSSVIPSALMHPTPVSAFHIRLFTPAWHAIVMVFILSKGTGAVSILFNVFPYGTSHHGLQITALGILFLNIAFFIFITALSVLRYILFPQLWCAMLTHPTQSLFIGCFPMGFATIIIASLGVVYQYFGLGGRPFVYALWAMWWVDVAVSLVICFGQLHFMFTRQSHSLERMTLIWLLPIVTLIVSSAAGAVLAQYLIPSSSSNNIHPNLSHVYLTLGVCMLLVTIGITLALCVIAIYILRLAVYKVPKGVAIFSVFLPLGPLGQAGFTYVALGQVAASVFPLPLPSSSGLDDGDGIVNILANEHAGEILNLLAWTLGLALWSFATCWVVLAFFALAHVLKSIVLREEEDPPFKVTFWGMIFPNGVYANLTIHLASSIDSQILRVWGAIYTCFTTVLWLFALLRTVATLKDASVFEELVGIHLENHLGGRSQEVAEGVEIEADTDVLNRYRHEREDPMTVVL